MAKNPLKDFVVPYPAEALIFKEGDEGSEMYIIQTGKVEIFKENNGDKYFSRILERGDFFGEMSLLEGVKRTASARVIEDSEIIEINAATFDKMIQVNVEIAVRMLRKLSIRLRETTEQLEAVIAQAGPDKTKVIPPITSVSKDLPEDQKPPVLAQLIMDGSLKVYPIYRELSYVGRYDPSTGTTPDVDLSEEDVRRSTSRHHARLQFINGQFYIMEEAGSLNGTYVDGKRIQAGVKMPIKNGTILGFGMLKMKFVEKTHKGK